MSIKLDLIGIVVKDVSESLRFYSLLGVEVPQETGSPHLEARLPNGLTIAWDTEASIREIYPDWITPTGHRMGLAFLCDSPAAVDAKYAEVVAAGFSGHREPWDAFWGQRYAQVADPDGNLVDLFAPLAENLAV